MNETGEMDAMGEMEETDGMAGMEETGEMEDPSQLSIVIILITRSILNTPNIRSTLIIPITQTILIILTIRHARIIRPMCNLIRIQTGINRTGHPTRVLSITRNRAAPIQWSNRNRSHL